MIQCSEPLVAPAAAAATRLAVAHVAALAVAHVAHVAAVDVARGAAAARAAAEAGRPARTAQVAAAADVLGAAGLLAELRRRTTLLLPDVGRRVAVHVARRRRTGVFAEFVSVTVFHALPPSRH